MKYVASHELLIEPQYDSTIFAFANTIEEIKEEVKKNREDGFDWADKVYIYQLIEEY